MLSDINDNDMKSNCFGVELSEARAVSRVITLFKVQPHSAKISVTN